MTFVVTESCIKCKYQDCVPVCPAVCFHEGPEYIVIDPEECVDCAVCVDYCPVNAIKDEVDLAPHEQIFLDINRELSKKWPVIESKNEVPHDADNWAGVKNKLIYITDGNE